jgi:hypothetical protein
MRKNLVNYSLLVASSKRDAMSLLQETYKISGKELKVLDSMSLLERLYYAGRLLLDNSIRKVHLSANEGFAQITFANLAALCTDWDNPNADILKLKDCMVNIYGSGGETTVISRYRRHIGTDALGRDFVLNHENIEKNPGSVQYSSTDQTDGLKLPDGLNPRLSFLLGVYRSDGNPSASGKNRLKLSGQSDDGPFYVDCLEKLIGEQFNLLVKSRIVQRNRIDGVKTYSWNDVCLEVISKGHFQFLLDMGLIDYDGRFLPLDMGSGLERASLGNSLAYLCGMIAAGGHISAGDRSIMQFNDHAGNFVPEMMRVIHDCGYPFAFSNPKKKPWHMSFNRRQLVQMSVYRLPFRISEPHLGLFVNPKHIEKIMGLEKIRY